MGDQQALIVAPAVSVIVAELAKRPAWQHDQPLEVPSELWTAAREEMRAVLKKRGFPLAVEKSVKADNFLVYGVPVVTNG